MFVMKGYFPIDSERVRLSAVVGAGVMTADFDSHLDGTGDDADLCFKLGLGLDVFVIQEISIGFEGSWTNGIDNYSSDVKDFGGIEYFNFTLGVAYHF
jgi:opacity protein-like surface antigen